jgi:hypothetical protein
VSPKSCAAGVCRLTVLDRTSVLDSASVQDAVLEQCNQQLAIKYAPRPTARVAVNALDEVVGASDRGRSPRR